eukprot:m.142710 g.142710  ORF g.142710 m.142710 type:complete len:1843 (+) comp14068_c0_seq1:317-5845(+)
MLLPFLALICGALVMAVQPPPSPSLFPPFALFEDQPLCQPVQLDVVVVNADPRHTLTLLAANSQNAQFHCSNFKATEVLPGKNTTFTIIYLPQQLGRVESKFTISTSLGDLEYEVFGTGTLNPNRLLPIVSGRIPAQLRLAQPIVFHNPSSLPIQIEEVFSSNDAIQLDMNTMFNTVGNQQSDVAHAVNRTVWQIPPYKSKPIILVIVSASDTAGVVSGFITVRTNVSEYDAVIPVHVVVSSDTGLYYGPGDSLDFSVVTRSDPRRHKSLQLLYKGPAKTEAQVLGIRVLSCQNVLNPEINCAPISIHQRQSRFRIKPFAWTRVATVSLASGALINTTGFFSGILAVEYTCEESVVHVLKIPFFVHYAEGALEPVALNTSFFVGKQPFKRSTRAIMIKNTYAHPVAVEAVRLPNSVSSVFKLGSFSKLVLQPMDTMSFDLSFKANASDLALQSHVIVSTNQSDVPIALPIFAYNGFLKYAVDGERTNVDFGTVSLNDQPTSFIHILNPNPVSVKLLQYTTTLEEVTLAIESMTPSSDLMDLVEYGKMYTNNKVIPDAAKLAKKAKSPSALTVKIEPGHVATLRVTLTQPREKNASGDLSIFSTYHELRIPVEYVGLRRVLNLTPSLIQLGPSFPNQRYFVDTSFTDGLRDLQRNLTTSVGQDLFIQLEKQSFDIEKISSNDERIEFESNPDVVHGISTAANSLVKLGLVRFNPNIMLSHEDNYMPQSPLSFNDVQHRFELLKNHIDEVHRANTAWRKLSRQGKTSIKSFLYVQAKHQTPVPVEVRAQLQKPRILVNTTLTFPLTQVRLSSTLAVQCHNPSFMPIALQVIPMDDYIDTDMQTQMQTVFGIQSSSLDAAKKSQGAFRFHPPSQARMESSSKSATSPFPNTHSHTVIVPPNTTISLPIEFHPANKGSLSSYLLFVNNLTVVEFLPVTGQAGQGTFGFPKTQVNVQNDTLSLPVSPDSLSFCNSGETHDPQLFFFNFTVVNRGNMPTRVLRMEVDGQDCANSDFQIAGCSPFTIEPKGYKKLVIGFAPDFTAVAVQSRLSVFLQGQEEPLTFSMQASVPRHMLGKCFRVMPSPAWATHLKPVALAVCALVIFAMLVVEHLSGTLPSKPGLSTTRSSGAASKSSSRASSSQSSRSGSAHRALRPKDDKGDVKAQMPGRATTSTKPASMRPVRDEQEQEQGSTHTSHHKQSATSSVTQAPSQADTEKRNVTSTPDLSGHAAHPDVTAVKTSPKGTPKSKRKKRKKAAAPANDATLLDTNAPIGSAISAARTNSPLSAGSRSDRTGSANTSHHEEDVEGTPVEPEMQPERKQDRPWSAAHASVTPTAGLEEPTVQRDTVSEEQDSASQKSPVSNIVTKQQDKKGSTVNNAVSKVDIPKRSGSKESVKKTRGPASVLKIPGAMPAVADSEEIIAKALKAAKEKRGNPILDQQEPASAPKPVTRKAVRKPGSASASASTKTNPVAPPSNTAMSLAKGSKRKDALTRPKEQPAVMAMETSASVFPPLEPLEPLDGTSPPYGGSPTVDAASMSSHMFFSPTNALAPTPSTSHTSTLNTYTSPPTTLDQFAPSAGLAYDVTMSPDSMLGPNTDTSPLGARISPSGVSSPWQPVSSPTNMPIHTPSPSTVAPRPQLPVDHRDAFGSYWVPQHTSPQAPMPAVASGTSPVGADELPPLLPPLASLPTPTYSRNLPFGSSLPRVSPSYLQFDQAPPASETEDWLVQLSASTAPVTTASAMPVMFPDSMASDLNPDAPEWEATPSWEAPSESWERPDVPVVETNSTAQSTFFSSVRAQAPRSPDLPAPPAPNQTGFDLFTTSWSAQWTEEDPTAAVPSQRQGQDGWKW